MSPHLPDTVNGDGKLHIRTRLSTLFGSPCGVHVPRFQAPGSWRSHRQQLTAEALALYVSPARSLQTTTVFCATACLCLLLLKRKSERLPFVLLPAYVCFLCEVLKPCTGSEICEKKIDLLPGTCTKLATGLILLVVITCNTKLDRWKMKQWHGRLISFHMISFIITSMSLCSFGCFLLILEHYLFHYHKNSTDIGYSWSAHCSQDKDLLGKLYLQADRSSVDGGGDYRRGTIRRCHPDMTELSR
ncbi:uncharacterized protein [Triticum aestivum]|uniref:uncharacterized protein n=1 Tax=Triticum aestivum TaxID=4565 RepID=UPI001D01D6CF|nr:uncharacterized protein LOC123101386 [Triticum aestivum]